MWTIKQRKRIGVMLVYLFCSGTPNPHFQRAQKKKKHPSLTLSQCGKISFFLALKWSQWTLDLLSNNIQSFFTCLEYIQLAGDILFFFVHKFTCCLLKSGNLRWPWLAWSWDSSSYHWFICLLITILFLIETLFFSPLLVFSWSHINWQVLIGWYWCMNKEWMEY